MGSSQARAITLRTEVACHCPLRGAPRRVQGFGYLPQCRYLAALNLRMIGIKLAAGAFGVGEPDRIEFKSAHLAVCAVAKYDRERNAIKSASHRGEIGHAVLLCRSRGKRKIAGVGEVTTIARPGVIHHTGTTARIHCGRLDSRPDA